MSMTRGTARPCLLLALLWLCACSDLLRDNPDNCARNPDLCGANQVGNQQTRLCEAPSCANGGFTCDTGQACDPQGGMCQILDMRDSVTCTNGIKDAGESDVDCGHVCTALCRVGQACALPGDCA